MDLSKAIICNAKNKSEHCLTVCFHGKPHEQTGEKKNACHTKKIHCNLMEGKATSVICRKLFVKEIEYFKGKMK